MSKFFLVFIAFAAAMNVVGWVATDISIYAFNTGVLLFILVDEVTS